MKTGIVNPSQITKDLDLRARTYVGGGNVTEYNKEKVGAVQALIQRRRELDAKAIQKLLGKPAFTHDCPACLFVGTVLTEKGGKVDLYVCPHSLDPEPCTPIARWGSDGPDYTSGYVFAISRDGKPSMNKYLAEALKRAKEMRLVRV